MPKIIKVSRSDTEVKIRYFTEGLAAEEHDAKFQEAPMPSFDKALEALAPIAANILETGKEWSDHCTVRGLTVTYTKHGTKSARIKFLRVLDAVNQPHAMETPLFRIDAPAETEQGARECSEKQSKQIYAMIEEAEKYLGGERQQMLLPLPKPAEPEEGEILEMNGANG